MVTTSNEGQAGTAKSFKGNFWVSAPGMLGPSFNLYDITYIISQHQQSSNRNPHFQGTKLGHTASEWVGPKICNWCKCRQNRLENTFQCEGMFEHHRQRKWSQVARLKYNFCMNGVGIVWGCVVVLFIIWEGFRIGCSFRSTGCAGSYF